MIGGLALRTCSTLLCRQNPAVLLPLARHLSNTNYQYINTDLAGTDNRVGVVTLNRPKALNALCAGLMDELIKALNEMDNDPTIGAWFSQAVKSPSLLELTSRKWWTGISPRTIVKFPGVVEQHHSGQETSHSRSEWLRLWRRL